MSAQKVLTIPDIAVAVCLSLAADVANVARRVAGKAGAVLTAMALAVLP